MTGVVVVIYEPDDGLFEQVRRVYEVAGHEVRRVSSMAELKGVGGVRAGLAGSPDKEVGIVVKDCEQVHIHYHWPEDKPK